LSLLQAENFSGRSQLCWQKCKIFFWLATTAPEIRGFEAAPAVPLNNVRVDRNSLANFLRQRPLILEKAGLIFTEARIAVMKLNRPYRDRREAGQILATEVRDRIGAPDAVVLALPRGGVPVGLEVALALEAPLDVVVVRKLGVPVQPELAMGAIAPGGCEVLNDALIADLRISPLTVAAVADREIEELRRRETLYRANQPPVGMRGRVVVLVDDGLATGFTMRAAIGAARQGGAGKLVVAVPVGAPDTCAEIAATVDLLICPFQPEFFQAVGMWYHDFSPTMDAEVCECLVVANGAAAHGFHRSPTSQSRMGRW